MSPQEKKITTEEPKKVFLLEWEKCMAIAIGIFGLCIVVYGVREIFFAGPSAKTDQEMIQECEETLMLTQLADQSHISIGELKGLYLANQNDGQMYYFSAQKFCRQNRTRKEILKEQTIKLSNSVKRRVEKVPFEKKPANLQIYELIHANSAAYLPLRDFLIESCEKGNCSAEDMKGVSYLHSLEGSYEDMETMAQESCEKHETNCTKDVALVLSGYVKNDKGEPIKGAKIEVLSDASVGETETDAMGQYRLEFPTYDFVKVRIKASKVGYSDGVIPLDIIQGTKKLELSDLDFVINAPVKVVTLNNVTGEVVGGGAEAKDNKFIITTAWSRYEIPFDTFAHKEGTPFTGELDAFLFEFDKDSDLTQFMENDTFDEVVGYAGDLMKTFGMPYVLFKTKTGETIHVLKSKPMLLQSRISEMEALETAQDKVYEPLRQEDIQYLVEQSQTLGGYPVDRDFLIKHMLVKFPAFWVFDQKKGIWENVGVKVLDANGTIETPFYTINDMK